MKVRILILGLCWLALSTQADADAGVRAQSAEACAAYADLALVASTR